MYRTYHSTNGVEITPSEELNCSNDLLPPIRHGNYQTPSTQGSHIHRISGNNDCVIKRYIAFGGAWIIPIITRVLPDESRFTLLAVLETADGGTASCIRGAAVRLRCMVAPLVHLHVVVKLMRILIISPASHAQNSVRHTFCLVGGGYGSCHERTSNQAPRPGVPSSVRCTFDWQIALQSLRGLSTTQKMHLD
jgi:hypothetical protein